MHERSRETTESRRILVVVDESADGALLRKAIRRRAAEVLVVAPALNSRLRHWTSDEDAARRDAQARLRHCLEHLEDEGVAARGVVGDPDPLHAIADALHGFAADEVVIAAKPGKHSHWLTRGVVERARTRFAVPVTQAAVERTRSPTDGRKSHRDVAAATASTA